MDGQNEIESMTCNACCTGSLVAINRANGHAFYAVCLGPGLEIEEEVRIKQ